MATPEPRGYRSATEYRFDKEHTNAIVRTATYRCRDFCLSVIWFSPREHVDVRQSIATPFQRTPNIKLGSLDWLPLELLHDTLFRLDMHSLFKFRQTNLRARQTVDSLKPYQLVVSHGLNLFCALLRTRLAIDISLHDFYDALCTKSCTLCGEFGEFISLLTWKRCCFKCLQEAPETQMHTLNFVRKHFHLNKVKLDQLKSFKTLPGTYSLEDSVRKPRTTIISVHQTILICGRQPHIQPQVPPLNSHHNRRFNFMGACALPWYDRPTGTVECGISCAGCELALEKGIIGTWGERWAYEARDRIYARDGFLEHFQWCEQAQLLWTKSDEGENQPVQLPKAVRRGGYFEKRE